MIHVSKLILCPLVLLILNACNAQPQYELFNVLLGKDHHGPVLLKTETTGDFSAVYHFDEMVFCSSEDFSMVSAGNQIVSVRPYEQTVHIEFLQRLQPGQRHSVRGRVADLGGNTLTFTAGVWGHNGDIPNLIINEFSTKGTESNPDRIELLAKSKGNLAGVALYIGMAEAFDSEFVLPARTIERGERLVIAYGYPPDDEQVLYGSSTGIGSNNGVISLYSSPEGTILDAVIYSNRSSTSDENYHGFGTAKVCQWAEALDACGAWKPHAMNPDTAIDSSYSTATRSFCRNEGSDDTDTKDDWHIVPTRGASFGEPNSNEVYSPKSDRRS